MVGGQERKSVLVASGDDDTVDILYGTSVAKNCGTNGGRGCSI